MLFLVSGASGAGKSTVRELLAPCLGADFEAVELKDLGSTENVTVQWRQQVAEVAATRAAAVAASGRHLLLSGDPVAVGEVIAAPSATDTGGIAPEPAKRRPAVVMEEDWLLSTQIATVLVVPLTSKVALEAFSGNVLIPVDTSGLGKDFVAMVAQVGPVSREFLEPHPVGHAPRRLQDRRRSPPGHRHLNAHPAYTVSVANPQMSRSQLVGYP